MSFWNWFDQCRLDWLAQGDQQRLPLTTLYGQAYEVREIDPNRALALLSEGRLLAEKLKEPFWMAVYEKFHLDGQMHFLRDYRRVLSPALRATLHLDKPELARFPDRFGVYDTLVSAYLGIDAEGHAEFIEETFSYLEKEVVGQPESARLTLLARRRQYAVERQRWAEAQAIGLRELALAQAWSDRSAAGHFASFTHAALCQIGAAQGHWQEVDDHARQGETSARGAKLEGELAECLVWQAAAARHVGAEDHAQALYRSATADRIKLAMPPSSGHFDAQAAFFLAGHNLPGALQVREREISFLANQGRLLAACRANLERVRLVHRIGPPYDEILPAAREQAALAARQVKTHNKYLQLLHALAGRA